MEVTAFSGIAKVITGQNGVNSLYLVFSLFAWKKKCGGMFLVPGRGVVRKCSRTLQEQPGLPWPAAELSPVLGVTIISSDTGVELCISFW